MVEYSPVENVHFKFKCNLKTVGTRTWVVDRFLIYGPRGYGETWLIKIEWY